MDNIVEIKQIVSDYLADNNTDYSIMITGQWGTGKTHFLRNTLEPELGKELLYITLNGSCSRFTRKPCKCVVSR